ncbi:MAG: S24 family peptidase [Bacillota bacterium]
MSTLAKRLKKTRSEVGLTQNDVAKQTGINRATLANWETGRTEPDWSSLKVLAELYGVDINYLLGSKEVTEIDLLDILEGNNTQIKAGDKIVTKEQRLNLIRVLDNPSTLQSKTVPILGKIKMGIPILAEGNWDGELEIPSDIRADFALEARGNSMIGVGLLDGDYAICREVKTANSGNIVVALREISTGYSEATLKYYFNDREGSVLRAANPDFEDIPMNEEWRITGVLVAILRKEAPPYRVYNSYLAARDVNKEKWDPVFEKASRLGIKPEQVEAILDMIYQTAKK